MNRKHGNAAVSVLSILVVLFLMVMAVWNVTLLRGSLRNLLRGQIDFTEFTSQVQEQYQGNLQTKYTFINLNGWFAKAIDQTICNETIRLNNGMLGSANIGNAPENTIDKAKDAANRLIRFDQSLKALDIPFLYVQAPYKIDQKAESLPEGFYSQKNDNADLFLENLNSGGVHTLDLRPLLSANSEMTQKYFFHTDPHWTHEAAFIGAQQVAQELKAIRPELDISLIDFDQWDSHVLEKWSLGSQGKRVGVYFGGTDDITYYTPKFETAMSCAIPDHLLLYKGDFSDAHIREQYIKERDYFGYQAYSLYVGGQYPLTRYRNPGAPNKLRVLTVLDSFGRPMLCFLSTLFQEIDVIDPRNIDSNIVASYTVAEYAQYYLPDIVLQCINPSTISDDCFTSHGVVSASARDAQPLSTVQTFPEVDIPIDSDGNFVSLSVNLTRGQRYILRFDDVEFLAGTSEGVAICLYDLDEEKMVDSAVFDVEYSRTYGDFSWFFAVPEDASENLELRFCAGLPKDDGVENNAAIYHNVRLEAIG